MGGVFLGIFLDVRDEIFDEVHVFLFALIDAFAESRREGMVLVQHDGDLAVAGAEYDFHVQADEGAETIGGVGDLTNGGEDALLGDLHGVIHDFEKDFVLALKVVIEAALAEFQGAGDVIHGGGVIAALLKQARGSAQNFLPGIDRGFAWHRVTW